MGENGDHVFVSIGIEMVHLVPSVQKIGERIWWRGVGDR